MRLESGIDRMKVWVLGICCWVWNCRGDRVNGVDGWSLWVERWVVGLLEGFLEFRGRKEVLLLLEGIVLKLVNK